MRCANCGQELSAGARFCPGCGTKVPDGAGAAQMPGGTGMADAANAAGGDDAPLYRAEVKGLLRSGVLTVYRDRTEFVVSSVQKMVFRYASLAALKKGLDRINFIMEDGHTESCTVNRKNLHEAFYTIEQACRPYLAARRQAMQAAGIRFSFPGSRQDLSGLLNSGMLDILDDRCEYRTPAGKGDTVAYADVKSVRLSPMGALEFVYYDGTKKAFTADKEQREEALAFLKEALVPFIEERKARLLAQGIYFSFIGDQGFGRGVLNIYADRLEYKTEAGQEDTVPFARIRTVHTGDGMLETAFTDGTTRMFPIDREAAGEVLDFMNKAIEPYVAQRTDGFDQRFGSHETLEFNEARGVFHVLRQSGREISEEYPMADLLKAEAVQTKAGRDIVSTLLARGSDAKPPEERIADLGVLLTVRTDQGTDNVPVCLGSFAFGAERTGPEYTRCLAELDGLFAWLAEHCPACETVELPPEAPPAPLPAEAEAPADGTADAAAPAVAAGPAEAAGLDKGQFGTLVDGIANYIGQCATPMTIAIQGDWETGQNSFLHMVYNALGEAGIGGALWLPTWQFSQFDLGEQLPARLADKLNELLGAGGGEETRTRAKMVAQGVIGLVSGFISQGSSDGQKLNDAFFRDDPTNSLEQRRQRFAELVRRRAGESGKVIIFVDDLNRLAPAKVVALLDALRYFMDCPGCLFVAAVDRETAVRGKQELNGPGFSEQAGDAWFDKLFKTAFRVPKSSFDVQKYIRDNLGRADIRPDDETEPDRYARLAQLSVGGDPKALERIFNSFFLLKNVAGAAAFASPQRRLALFGLLCMQSRFPGVYRALLAERDRLTPQRLSSLPAEACPAEGATDAFCAFYRELCAAASAQGTAPDEQDCRDFAAALAASAVTAAR